MFMRFLPILVSSLLFFAAAAPAAEPPHHTQARLFSSVEGVDQLKTVQVGVEVTLEPGWKTYWRTPGEAGLAPVFDWAGSTNIKSTQVEWPTPVRFTSFDIDNFGYENTVTFPIDITLQEPGHPLELSLKLDLLICNKLCVPETQRLSLTIPARESKVSADQPKLAAAVQKVPATGAPEKFSVQNIWVEQEEDNKNYIHVNAVAEDAFSRETDMFVESSPFVSFGRPSVSYDPPTQQLHLQALVRSTDPVDVLKKNLGQAPLIVTVSDHGKSFERKFTMPSAVPAQAATGNPVGMGVVGHEMLGIILLAFVGGFILNLMPCVLPVLSIKILSVLSHGGKDHRIYRGPIFRSFIASALGILFSFWVMAGALILLKATGQSLGWGIQFQHPGFLIFLIVVLSAFAVNMSGFFEFPLPQFIVRSLPAKHEQQPTLFGHFLTGAFAALLATPCTAPFLGTAIGFALAGEAADILVVFTFLGLGLAFPYIVLAISPKIFKYMPKPGRWMIVLRKVLAGALALTVVWLVNVLVTVSTQTTLDDGWMTFDEALIKPAVEEGKTVVVDITADWCLTCKANKRLVLEQQDVEDALTAPNVVRMQADWTQHNETISAYMRKFGRYGVPFNIVYGPGAPNGIILGELLSKQEVMRALSEAADE